MLSASRLLKGQPPPMTLERACFSFVDRIWIIASESIAGKTATCWDQRAKMARDENRNFITGGI
jgi:hypothetical protein